MNIANHKKSILIIIALLLAFFGYWYFFISKKDTSTQNTGQIKSTNTKAGAPVSGGIYSKEFVASLVGFNNVKLDVSIFESKEYKALNYPEKPFDINYSKESGRDNPFLPIGIEGRSFESAVQTQTQTVTPVPNTVVPSKTNTVAPGTVLPPTSPSTQAPVLPPKPIQKTF